MTIYQQLSQKTKFSYCWLLTIKNYVYLLPQNTIKNAMVVAGVRTQRLKIKYGK